MPILSLLIILLMVGALIDIITRGDAQVKHLPKLMWIVIVVLLPLIGSILWFALGREYGDAGITIPNMRRARRPLIVDDRPAPRVDTRTTEQQIADLDREIEEWRLKQEMEKRRREDGDAAPGTGVA